MSGHGNYTDERLTYNSRIFRIFPSIWELESAFPPNGLIAKISDDLEMRDEYQDMGFAWSSRTKSPCLSTNPDPAFIGGKLDVLDIRARDST